MKQVTKHFLHVLGLPLFYFVADKDNAPGLVFVGTVIPFASMVIAVFAIASSGVLGCGPVRSSYFTI